MANFNDFVKPGEKRFNRLNDDRMNLSRNDAGNFNSRGELIGTRRSISAPVLESYLGRVPTASDMANLSLQTATEIMDKKFWRKNRLTEFNDQRVANFVCDIASSAGNGTAIKLLQKALNELGKNLVTDGVCGNLTIAAVNSVPAEDLYKAFYDEVFEFYTNANSSKYFDHVGDLNKWYPRNGYNKNAVPTPEPIPTPSRVSTGSNTLFYAMGLAAFIAAGTYVVERLNKKYQFF